MTHDRSLPVLMPRIASQRWSCHSCTRCCRELVVHLTDDDRRKLDRQRWTTELGTEPYVPLRRGWALNKRPDGACIFLDPDGLCRIHRRYGAEAKPFACRIYPFSVRSVRGGWQASIRFDCPSAAGAKGEPLSNANPWLTELLQGERPDTAADDGTADLIRGLPATGDEIDAVHRGLSKWLGRTDLPPAARLIGAARLTTTLAEATLRKVRGPRFAELLDLLFQDLPQETQAAPEPPTERQRGMIRQLAFAHAEHLPLAAMRAVRLSRMQRRLRQLRDSRRFRRGKGPVPALPGLAGRTTFADVASVSLPDNTSDEFAELIFRYVTARLQSRSVFGAGYYGWPAIDGLTALWLSLAAAGWLTRYHAAGHHRQTADFNDLVWGLGTVDRAATRLPVLGAVAERARIAYLRREDGLARLVGAYALLGKRR